MVNNLKLSDHLVVSSIGYTHHGIYSGNGRVIYYSGISQGKGIRTGPVKESSLEVFLDGRDYTIKDHIKRKYSRDASVTRAKRRIGENLYKIWGNNCEHFVNNCIEGDSHSDQVERGKGGLISSTTTAAAGGGTILAASSLGSVAGLSGSGIMSGLATVGSVVGGGVVAGIGTVAGAGGAITSYTMNKTLLKDKEFHSKKEREARSIGRKATVVGAATATAGSVATISAAGTMAGLSGAGITSGLAAIGGAVGGGMAAGAVITAAAPAAVAAGVGYGLYKAVKWFKKRK